MKENRKEPEGARSDMWGMRKKHSSPKKGWSRITFKGPLDTLLKNVFFLKFTSSAKLYLLVRRRE